MPNAAYKIITFDNGFHGRTLATISASGKKGWDSLFEPKVPGFIKVPFNDLAVVSNAIDKQTVAIMLEPIQGEAGVIPANMEFIQGLRKLADKHQLLLIFDEIQTGIGRTGELFCYQHFNIEPDIMTLGKGLGGGVPLAALLAKKQVSCFESGDQGGTFNGNPLVTAAGNAVINEILQSDFLQDVKHKSHFLQQCLNKLAKKHKLGAVRGRGLLLALDTQTLDATVIVKYAFEQKLLLQCTTQKQFAFYAGINHNNGRNRTDDSAVGWCVI